MTMAALLPSAERAMRRPSPSRFPQQPPGFRPLEVRQGPGPNASALLAHVHAVYHVKRLDHKAKEIMAAA